MTEVRADSGALDTPKEENRLSDKNVHENESDASTEVEDIEDEVEEYQDDKDVFEITDFTTASPWETLANDFERQMRVWGLEAGAPNKGAPTSTAEANIVLRGREYKLILYVLEKSASSTLNPVAEPFLGKESTNRTFREGGFEAIPAAMAALLSVGCDFIQVDQPIIKWFGVTEFLVVVSTATTSYSDKISLAEAKMIQSALTVAVNNTRCQLPVFTQVDESKKENFIGCALASGMLTSFDTACIGSVPRAYNHLSGLLALFRSKIGTVKSKEHISITTRFTYKRQNWFDDWMTRNDEDEESETTLFGDEYLKSPLDLIPIGLTADPISAINLYTTWPHFHEHAVLENAVHSELDPKLAPLWSLEANMHANTNRSQGKLATLLSNLSDLLKSFGSQNKLLDSIESPEEEERDAKDAFKGITHSPDRMSGQKLRGKIKHIVGRTINTAKHVTNRVQGKFPVESVDLSDEDLDTIWLRLFGDDDWDDAFTRDKMRKGAPHFSFVSELATTMALIGTKVKGIVVIALLWKEIVQDIEYNYWKELRDIPRVTPGIPDMGFCLVYQKLQMINCCIKRQRSRNEMIQQKRQTLRKQKEAERAKYQQYQQQLKQQQQQLKQLQQKPDGDEDDSDDFQSADEFEGSNNDDDDDDHDNDDDDDDDDEDDDLYYLAPEDEEGLKVRNEQLRQNIIQQTTSSPTPSVEEEKEVAPVGVRSVSTTLMLLGTTTPLRIPVTQEEGPMTEDMLQRKQDMMTEMGTTAEAVQARVTMQSQSLRSDMMAFKAANPGCRIEDFVRWHSPRDFVVEDGQTVDEGRLSGRMLQPDNIWNQIWGECESKPVNRQHSLFDATKEALEALDYLSSITASELIWQLFVPLVRDVEIVLWKKIDDAFGDDTEALDEDMKKLSKLCERLGNDFAADCQKIAVVIEQVEIIEKKLFIAKSLTQTLGESGKSLVSKLLSGEEVPLFDDVHRQTIFEIFSKQTGELGAPQSREFIFRLLTTFPSDVSRPGVNRMYCSLSDSNFRVAGAFSEDKVFG